MRSGPSHYLIERTALSRKGPLQAQLNPAPISQSKRVSLWQYPEKCGSEGRAYIWTFDAKIGKSSGCFIHGGLDDGFHRQ